MNRAIERRVVKAAQYIAEHGATVRRTASVMGVSKSTVHKDMETRLEGISTALYKEVQAVFERNKRERHIRGGEATRRRYARMREDGEPPAGEREGRANHE